MNLTPEQLAFLQQYANQPGWQNNGTGGLITDQGGQTWHPTYTGLDFDPGSGNNTTTLTGYMRDTTPGANAIGDTQDMYNTSGVYGGTAAIPKNTDTVDLLKFAAMAAAMGYGGDLLNGLGGATGGGMQTAGAYDSLFEGAASTMGGGGGAYPGATSFGVVGETAPMSASSSGSYGGGAYDAGGSSAYNSLNGSDVMSDSFAKAGGAGAGGFGGGGGVATTGLLAGLDKYGKYLAPVLGGLLGSQGVKKNETYAKDIPEWLKPYVIGNNGILNATTAHMNANQATGNSSALQNMGMGLLNKYRS